MGFCDCNQGRLSCTCKDDPVGEVIAEDIAKHTLLPLSELKKPNPVDHYTAMANDAATVVRITAERDALQLLLNDRDERIDNLTGLLNELNETLRYGGGHGWEDRACDKIESALHTSCDQVVKP